MKKIIFAILILCVCICSLSACSKEFGEPIEIAKKLVQKDYYVQILVDDEEIEDMCDGSYIRSSGVDCIIMAEPDDYSSGYNGLFIVCESKDAAKDCVEAMERRANEMLEELIRGTLERRGNIIFLGSSYVLDDLD